MANLRPFTQVYFTQSLLNEIFYYKKGALFWKISGRGIPIDRRAGSPQPDGDRRISYNKVVISEHRAIWIMHYGDIPYGYEVDHKDNNKFNNFLSNLRIATSTQNTCNRRRLKSNKCGYKGVRQMPSNKWQARIRINKKEICLGVYITPELAYEAYKNAAIELHGEFANFG